MSDMAMAGDTGKTRLFRELLGCFPTGVAIITTRTPDGQPVGLTCNSFSSVSLEPPLVLFSLRSASRLLGTFAQADSFGINILSQRQDALSARFASGHIGDKFEGVAWRSGELRVPIVEDCLASFECDAFARHQAGDHYIFIGEVKHMTSGPVDRALVFYRGAYMMLAESLRTMIAQGRLESADLDEAARVLYGKLLRLACERATETEIDDIEAAVGFIEQCQATDMQHRHIEASSRFFASIAAAGHNAALHLMAQTMTEMLRERMTQLVTVLPQPELSPFRRELVDCLRRRDADGAAGALDRLIIKRREHAQCSGRA